MRRTARWLSILLSLNLSLAAVAPVTLAQGRKPKPVREELTPALRQDYDLAIKLFGDRNYAGAIVQFQRIYDASKNPRVLVNIGRSYQDDNKGPKAIQFYERAISESGTAMSADEVQQLRNIITQLRGAITTLDVTTNVPGVTVNVDGEDVGTTPLAKPVDIIVGSHVVKVSKSGFREQTRNIDGARGTPTSTKFEMVPEVLMTKVTVSAEGAPRANVRIDGIEMGPAPYNGQVEVGKAHKFEAYAPNFVTAEQSLDVKKQEPLTVVLRLSEQRAEGRVAIVARPAGAIISIDQKVVGTDKWEGVLTTGGHQVRITKGGYIDHVQEIGVANDQVRTVEATLRQDPSRGAVYWAVGAALVVIGGGITAYFVSTTKDAEPVRGTVREGIMPTWRH